MAYSTTAECSTSSKNACIACIVPYQSIPPAQYPITANATPQTALTPELDSTSRPGPMETIPGDAALSPLEWSVRTRPVVVEYCVRWSVAPRSESSWCQSGRRLLTRLPARPAATPNVTRVNKLPAATGLGLSSHTQRATVHPMTAPPPADAARPSIVIPPFVPGGTCCIVRICRGFVVARMPSSDASVSARLVA